MELTGIPWQIRFPKTQIRHRAAVAFVSYVVEVAEATDHRPGIELRDNTVTLTLTTHSAGGLTDKDFTLASKIRG